MNRSMLVIAALLIGISSIFLPTSVLSAINADYAGTPPFVASNVPPNVLLIVDNSDSMAELAYCLVTACPAFSELVTYSGLFDSMTCYDYNSSDTRFEDKGSLKQTIDAQCPSSRWDGNFLNWATFRRIDALKKAATGGTCVITRAIDGTCPPSGSPLLITIKGMDVLPFTTSQGSFHPAIPTGNGPGQAQGRVPNSVTSGAGNIYIHTRTTSPLQGTFCVDDDRTPLIVGAVDCIDGDGFGEQNFRIHLTTPSQPTGVIQQIGGRARFGLLEFAGSGPGGKVVTPIGGLQSVPFNSTAVTTYSSNVAAVLAAMDGTTLRFGTPLAESLYVGLNYIAQLPQPYSMGSYLYPNAWGPAGFGTNGQGSIGASEMDYLSPTDACSNYSAYGYTLAKTCGRDPFFLGSVSTAYQLPWSNPSTVSYCCATYIILLTDGQPWIDNNFAGVPPGLLDLAHGIHGTHCTGSAPYPAPVGTCNRNTGAPPPTSQLLKEHKTDYPTAGHWLDDLAYWGHTHDLRPDNGNPDPTLACSAPIPRIAVLGAVGHCLPGKQTVTVYTFYTFGDISARELLMQTARQGGFEDLNKDAGGPNGENTPDLVAEWDSVDNYTGLAGSDGLPDTYFESANAKDIQTKLLAVFTSLLQRASSGTGVAVLASSSNGEGVVAQGLFKPSTVAASGAEVTWTGYTQGFFIDQFGNLREDASSTNGCMQPPGSSPPDGNLVFKDDCIIRMRYDAVLKKTMVDRFLDTNGDGIPDGPAAMTVDVTQLQPVWEAGRRLALLNPGANCESSSTWPLGANLVNSGINCRRLLTWVDTNNDGLVGGNERVEFSAANVAALCPYVDGANVASCGAPLGQTEAAGIINFIRGYQPGGLRDRQLSVLDDNGVSVTTVWKLGDIMNSAPVIVGTPPERYDLIYGDSTYAAFFQRYKDRRQVAYAGANDGMLHAFNAGFYSIGDDRSTVAVNEQARITTVPVQPGTSTPCATLPCDGAVATYPYRSGTPKLGAELWGFIPQDLLPQLQWLTRASYDHVYYVDLKPKVSDVRIFNPDADHPHGWGTILIGGFRLGGSCTHCTQGKAPPRIVTADFNGDGVSTSPGDTRVFLSSYFVLDITNPEKDPVLLWVFRDENLGLTTAAPAILRLNPAADPTTSSANERWYVVFGSGVTHFDGYSQQNLRFFVVDLKLGPTYVQTNVTTGGPCSLTSPCITANIGGAAKEVRAFSVPNAANGYVGDAVTVDYNLDFRVDAAYAGSVFCNTGSSACDGTTWFGIMWRLNTNGGDPDPDTWGVSTGPSRSATALISRFACAPSCTSVGPIAAAPALSIDHNNSLWVFFGTGRYFSNNDKVNRDTQHFFGVKDSFLTIGSPAQTVERNTLLDVSSLVVCGSCALNDLDGDGVADGGLTAVVNNVQNVDGWFTTLAGSGERSLNRPTLIAGALFFTTFQPTNDICEATGTGMLYALFYLTGTAHTQNMIGTSTVGGNTMNNVAVSLGTGMWSQVAVHIGAQGTGSAGANAGANAGGVPGAGCISRITLLSQSSTGQIGQVCGNPPLAFWSRLVSWRDL